LQPKTTTKKNLPAHPRSALSLLTAQIVGAGVQKLNPQTIRTSNVGGGIGIAQQTVQQQQQQTIQAQTGGNSTASIQLLGTIQPRARNVQVVGTKQLANRQLITTQRQIGGSTLKLATTPVNGESKRNRCYERLFMFFSTFSRQCGDQQRQPKHHANCDVGAKAATKDGEGAWSATATATAATAAAAATTPNTQPAEHRHGLLADTAQSQPSAGAAAAAATATAAAHSDSRKGHHRLGSH